MTVEVKFPEAFTESGKTASQHNLHPMHALGYIIFLCLGFTIVRQQIVTIENQVRKTYQADDDADLAQFEHTHSLSA